MQPTAPLPPITNTTTQPPPIPFPSFQTTSKQITAYGATALSPWDKKAYHQKRHTELGYRQERAIATPLKALQGMNAKNVQRREKADTRARESGLQVKSRRRLVVGRRGAAAGGGVRGEDVGIERGGGGRSDGMVRVGRAMAERLSRPDRHVSLAKRMKKS